MERGTTAGVNTVKKSDFYNLEVYRYAKGNSNVISFLHVALKVIFGNVFLKYDSMKQKYQVLDRLPALLPVIWSFRFFYVLFMKKTTFKRFMRQISFVKKNAKTYNQCMTELGFDYDFNIKK